MFHKSRNVRCLLLEGVDSTAEELFRKHGFNNVESVSAALPEAELLERAQDAQFIGIRSRTQLSAYVLNKLPNLKAVGCFCIGTNQVAINDAASLGIPVFNAPYSNTRSVAELIIGFTVILGRKLLELNSEVHAGRWCKGVNGSREVRGKTLGIVGYGHIGSQVSVLAEAMGMEVIYFDTRAVLPLGRARAVKFEDLLKKSDFVTLHVPESKETCQLIDADALRLMKPTAHLINASRGNVVDLAALRQRLAEGMLAGAALDVFPNEPTSKEEPFFCELQNLPNVILTPHIGGSTVEAQRQIALEVATSAIDYFRFGRTMGAVNFPEVRPSRNEKAFRLLHVHRNIPGMLQQINKCVSDADLNIDGQQLRTHATIGYVVLELSTPPTETVLSRLQAVDGTIWVRAIAPADSMSEAGLL